LSAGFQPGMGHMVPDRMFWAQGEDDAEDESATEAQLLDPLNPLTPPTLFDLPPNGTKH